MSREHRTSYLKTTALAGSVAIMAGAASLAILVLVQAGIASAILDFAGWVLAASCLLVASGGLVALRRENDQARGRVDMFRAACEVRSEAAVAAGRVKLHLRHWIGRSFRTRQLFVGEDVWIPAYEELRARLDANGALDGLPFQPEMRRFCGQRARVFRQVDKIYDYGRTKKLRSLKETYLLVRLRCDGSATGDCQAGCYAMWKRDWLQRDGERLGQPLQRSASESTTPASRGQYRCQFTELAAASKPLAPWSVLQDLRPLWAGNVTLAALLIATLTRVFNFVQKLRGGTGYPSYTPTGATSMPAASHGLNVGAVVRVASVEDIVRTLDKNGRNRGLWFDKDMVKHCRKTFHVLKRVDRIIDDATGDMRTMKTPCIVLRDVDYSGEFLRFCAQEEHLYWREAWLEPLATAQGTSSQTEGANHE